MYKLEYFSGSQYTIIIYIIEDRLAHHMYNLLENVNYSGYADQEEILNNLEEPITSGSVSKEITMKNSYMKIGL